MASDLLIKKTRATLSWRFKLHEVCIKKRLEFVTSQEELERVKIWCLGRKGLFNTLHKLAFNKGDISQLVDHYYDLVENPPNGKET